MELTIPEAWSNLIAMLLDHQTGMRRTAKHLSSCSEKSVEFAGDIFHQDVTLVSASKLGLIINLNLPYFISVIVSSSLSLIWRTKYFQSFIHSDSCLPLSPHFFGLESPIPFQFSLISDIFLDISVASEARGIIFLN